MQTPLAVAILFLYALCGVTALGLLVLFGLKLRNIAAEKQTKRCLEKYRDYFFYLQAHGEDEEQLRLPPGEVTQREKQIIQKKLFELMERFTGVHRQKLERLFEDMGLVDLDLKRLNGGWKWTRVDAAYNLGAMRSSRAVPELLGLLGKLGYDPSLFIVARAVAKCARDAEDLAGMVRELVRHRKNFHQLLVDILSESEVELQPLYASFLQDADHDLVKIGLIGLAQSNPAGVGERLDKLVRSADKEVRIKAVKLLCSDARQLTEKRVREFMAHPDWEIRAAVAKAAGTLGLSSSIPLLKKAVGDDNWWVSHHSARSLAQLDVEGFQALCEILQEGGPGRAVQMAQQIVLEELEKGRLQPADPTNPSPYNQKLYLYQNSRKRTISTAQA